MPYDEDFGEIKESGCTYTNVPKSFDKIVDLATGSSTLERYLSSETFPEKEAVVIRGRNAVRFRSDLITGGCVVALELPEGSAVVASSSIKRTPGPPPDSCADALRIANALVPVLPN